MKAAENTEIDAYLAAVEREASALPPQRRQELVADLAEHIQVALTERPDALPEVLRELGDPRSIAATALAESGVPAQAPQPGFRDRIPALLPVLVTALALPLVLLLMTPFGALAGAFGLLARIAGLVLLWVATCWKLRDKLIATFIAFVVPIGINIAVEAIDPPNPSVLMTLSIIQIALPILAATWLWFTRTRR